MSRGAPIGALVALTYDWRGPGPLPGVGHHLQTPAGSAYRIVGARQSPSRPGRVYLACVKVDAEGIPPPVYPMRWYPREPKARRRPR